MISFIERALLFTVGTLFMLLLSLLLLLLLILVVKAIFRIIDRDPMWIDEEHAYRIQACGCGSEYGLYEENQDNEKNS